MVTKSQLLPFYRAVYVARMPDIYHNEVKSGTFTLSPQLFYRISKQIGQPRMTSHWLSFVPRFVAVNIKKDTNFDQNLGDEAWFNAVVLFADVSGFTVMSEALAATGRSGTEELTTILNNYFETMISLVRSYGGVVGKFGGDALTILFPYDADSKAFVNRNAVQCALDMQNNMSAFEDIETSGGLFTLAMKAGLAHGELLTSTVGDNAIRLEYIIAGNPVDLSADAEHHAEKGDIIVHQDIVDLLEDVVIKDTRGDFAAITDMKTAGTHSATSDQPHLDTVTDEESDIFSKFLHPSISQRLRIGQSGFINEHRRVTVLFVNVHDLAIQKGEKTGQALQKYFEQVVNIVHRYDGYINKIDMGDKGSKYIILFGAPITHEQDDERAVRCAIDLKKISMFDISIGINTGLVYCGLVGSAERQEYTVMGDAVNLSARLMQAAKRNQILASDAVIDNVDQNTFEWNELEAITVKGKSKPIPVYSIEQLKLEQVTYLHEQTFSQPLVGREYEIKIGTNRIERTLDGQGQILGIVAEAGMGKSRLNAEIAQIAADKGFRLLGGDCEPHGTQSSYLVWQSIWRSLFDLSPTNPVSSQINRLTQVIGDINPTFIQRLPLLGIVFNLPIPENAFTKQLDPQLRIDLLKTLLAACIQHYARQNPLFIVLEDCHWIDPLSVDLLDFISNTITMESVMITCAYRPGDDLDDPMLPVRQKRLYTHLELDDFSPEEANQLIHIRLSALQDGDISSEIIAHIAERASGNPFYIEEIINFIQDRNVSLTNEDVTVDVLAIPNSLQSLILSRIDQLREEEQITVKVAAIIGRLFKESWVQNTYPEVGSLLELRKYLQNLDTLDITLLDRNIPEREYLFKHSTIREVAYESLTFSLRKVLHQNLANFIEQTYVDEIEQYIDVLAHHYAQTDDIDKQRYYYMLAGKRAQQAYANQTAIDYYTRLIDISDDESKCELLIELGRIYQLIGNWQEAEQRYRETVGIAEELANNSLLATSRLELGYLLIYTQKYDEAETLIQAAEILYKEIGDSTGLGDVYEYLGFLSQEQQNYEQALSYANQQLELAERNDNQKGMCEAMRIKGTVNLYLGNFEQALGFYNRQISIANEIDARKEIIYALGNMAGVYLYQGDYPKALECCINSINAAEEIGYLHASGVVLGNAAEIYSYQGEYLQSLASSSRSLEIMRNLGDYVGMATGMVNVATVEMELTNYQLAERIFEAVIRLAKAVEIPYWLSEFHSKYAKLLIDTKNIEQALKNAEQALDLAQQSGNADIEADVSIQIHYIKYLLGQVDSETSIEALNDLAGQFDESPTHIAYINYLIWKIDPSQEEAQQKATEIYKEQYQQTPKNIFAQRYYELTGDSLPEPEDLPILVHDWEASEAEWDHYINDVEAYLENLSAKA